VLEIESALETELREDGLKPEKAAVLAMLRGRLAREISADAPNRGVTERVSRVG